MNAKTLLIAPVLLGLLVAAACAGAGTNVASAPASSTSGSAQGNAAAPAQPGGDSTRAGGAPARSAGSSGDVITQPVPEGPRVQRSAQVTLEVPDGRFDSALNSVIAVVE